VSMINTFCLNPNTSTFDELRRRRGAFINNDADRGMAAAMSFHRALQELHAGLGGRLISGR
ncbi:MAG: hypothetical protein FWD28_11300, partial [Treponema sp.]|nr:hypothetical protein [Treponema sp.]